MTAGVARSTGAPGSAPRAPPASSPTPSFGPVPPGGSDIQIEEMFPMGDAPCEPWYRFYWREDDAHNPRYKHFDVRPSPVGITPR